MTRFSDTYFARLLRRLAQAVCQHSKWFVYPQICFFILSVLYAVYGLNLDTNREHLIGEQSRYHQISLSSRGEFPRPAELFLVVESNNANPNNHFIERLAARVPPKPTCSRISSTKATSPP